MQTKNIIVPGVAVLVVLAALTLVILNLQGLSGRQLVGTSCGTVSPDYQDECCARQNSDKVQIMCEGSWKFNIQTQECAFVCDTLQSFASNFDECVQAGYPVMESYPRQCRTPEGKTFTEIIKIIGGERDEHGCLIPAGYAWNETAGKCMRHWNGEVQGEPATDGNTTKECGSCPQFSPPAPNWCENGTIIAGQVNECGCQSPPHCLTESAETYSHNCTAAEKKNVACTLDWNPVCGSDGNTYGNGCIACSAGADSWVRGECRANSGNGSLQSN